MMAARVERVLAALFMVLAGGACCTSAKTTDLASLPWQDLNASLSSGANVFVLEASDYEDDCDTLGTDAYKISRAANGLCMHHPDCAHDFCQAEDEYNIPEYVVDVRVPTDIKEALAFATRHNITVSLKTSGHSYQGSSARKGSLLIWMYHYKKDGTIDTDLSVCGATYTNGTITVGGGQTWAEVYGTVKNDYHIVGGGGMTVSAAGGWLMGGGLSSTSRLYGLGIDNVLEFKVILVNGTTVTANRCTNTDLFWALRGGGGGAFGVVISVIYKLHPVENIVVATQRLYMPSSSSAYYVFKDSSVFVRHTELGHGVIRSFLKWWITNCVDLDDRWGGYWSPTSLDLYFVGSEADARATLLDSYNEWFDALDKSTWDGGWGMFPIDVTSYKSYYDLRGGADAIGDPFRTDSTGDAYRGLNLASRLIPEWWVKQYPEKAANLVYNLYLSGALGTVNYFLGGAMESVDSDSTSIHPAARQAIWNLMTFSDAANEYVREMVPNNITGVCYNHHSVLEPDWRNASWGKHYDSLQDLKTTYDQEGTLNCWHCVGYTGEEKEAVPAADLEQQIASSHYFYRFSAQDFKESATTISPTTTESGSSSKLFTSFVITMGVIIPALFL